MAWIDRGEVPRKLIGTPLLGALVAHTSRCPDCPPKTVETLAPAAYRGGERGGRGPAKQYPETIPAYGATADDAQWLRDYADHRGMQLAPSNALPCCTDPLGQPLDRTRAGRAKFEAAYEQAPGHYYGWPWVAEDESRDTDPDHLAGLHKRLPQDATCHACIADHAWELDHAQPTPHVTRRGKRVLCGPEAQR